MPSPSLLRRVVADLEAEFDVKAYLDGRDYIPTDANWAIDCPVCEKEGKQKKLHVLVEKRADKKKEPGSWICFFCGDYGGALDLVQRLEDLDFFAAVEVLRKFSRYVEREVDIKKFVEKALAEVPQSLRDGQVIATEVNVPHSFVSVCEESLRVPAYFRERGLNKAKAEMYKLGYCTSGRYANRLVVPVTRKGVFVGFQARWMGKTPPSGTKKYLNDGKSHASESLFGADQAKKFRRKQVILVEDVFSAMFVGSRGLSLRGTYLSRSHIGLIAETGAEEVVICLDRDAPGKAEKIAKQLVDLFHVRIAHLPDHRDPDEYSGRPLAFANIISQAAVYGSSTSLKSYVDARLSQAHGS